MKHHLRTAVAISERQHGVVGRGQLRAAGLDHRAVGRLIGGGHFDLLSPRVLRRTGGSFPPMQSIRAATLDLGDDARASTPRRQRCGESRFPDRADRSGAGGQGRPPFVARPSAAFGSLATDQLGHGARRRACCPSRADAAPAVRLAAATSNRTCPRQCLGHAAGERSIARCSPGVVRRDGS